MRTTQRRATLVGCILAFACHSSAFAQGSIAGSIFGTVTDTTGAFLAGVLVTCSSPAQMGVHTVQTNDRGKYRFPSLLPGVYRLSFERNGFTTLVRQDIVVTVNFAAEVDVELTIATVDDTIVVRGNSPLIDAQNTTIQNSFASESLKSLPSSRDLMSLVGLLPATIMSVSDVGGSTTGTVPIYLTYGQFNLQHFQTRIHLDGVNTTDGVGSGLYLDYGAFEEVRLGVSSNDASMPNPGLQINAVVKSGGNEFKGEGYGDFGDDTFQADNVDENLRRQGVGRGTRIQSAYDLNVNIGGPIKRDMVWFFTSGRNQLLKTAVAGFPVEAPEAGPDVLTRLQNVTYKLTYQPRTNSRLSHSLQLGRRFEPYRDASSTSYRNSVAEQDGLAWAGNVEWRTIVNPSFFMTARFSVFSSDVRANAYGTDGQVGGPVASRRFELESGNSDGGSDPFRLRRQRRQLEWNGTVFDDDWQGLNHEIRIGALSEWETTNTQRSGYTDSLRLRFLSRAMPDFSIPFQVQFYNSPQTATDRLRHHGAFVQDQIVPTRRLTLNIGLRWDSYSSYYPEQTLEEGPFTDFFYRGQSLPNGYRILDPPAVFGNMVRARNVADYRAAFGPRVGVAWKMRNNDGAVLKASWGRYYHDPATAISRDVNPLQTTSYIFMWNDGNRDRQFQLSELGSFMNSTGGVMNRVDPEIGHPFTDNMDIWMERRVRSDLLVRLGVVYKKSNNNWELAEQNRVAALFSERKEFDDPGPDGEKNTSDDRGYSAFDIPAGIPVPASLKEWQTPQDFDETFKSIEVAVQKRMSGQWSLSTSFVNTWVNRLENGHPDNPNEAINNAIRVIGWAFKAFGTYQAAHGISISPMVRHQAGRPSGRYVVSDPLNAGIFNILVEPAGTYREDNRTIVDARVAKQFRGAQPRTVSLFVDAFNLFNSNAGQAHDVFTGTRTTIINGQPISHRRFLRPLAILPPRTYRVGFALTF